MKKNEQNININNSSNLKIGDITFNVSEDTDRQIKKEEKESDQALDSFTVSDYKQALSEGKLKEVIAALKTKFSREGNTSAENSIVVISDRYNQYQNESAIGTGSEKELQLLRNKIIYGLANIIDIHI